MNPNPPPKLGFACSALSLMTAALLVLLWPGCVDSPILTRNNLDNPGPAALVCLDADGARSLRHCAESEKGYRLYVLQRFRSALVAIDVDARKMLDLDPFTPTANGIQLPGQALDLLTAPAGTALYLPSAPRLLIRVNLPSHEIVETALPFTAKRIISNPASCDGAEDCDTAPADGGLFLLSDGGDQVLRYRFIDGVNLAENPELLPNPPEAIGDIAIAHGKLVGPSMDGRRLLMLVVDGADGKVETEWSQISLGPECGDGMDNDGDGLTDGQDPSCARASGASEDGIDKDFACSNGSDDDGDGLTDMEDPGCLRGQDNDEWSEAGPCTDGVDNDGDGCTDPPGGEGCSTRAGPPANSGCKNPDALNFETSPCADGIDNDGDGQIDGDDDDCTDGEPGELPHSAPCGNGLDDNSNGLFDAPTDPACAHSASIAEYAPICGDGLDNDGDGAIDSDDPDCYGAFGKSEHSGATMAHSLVRMHPGNPIAYVLRSAQRDIVAVDLIERRVLSAHEDFPLWAHGGFSDSPLPGLPVGMIFTEAAPDADDNEEAPDGAPTMLKAYVAARSGRVVVYDPYKNRPKTLSEEASAVVFQPSLTVHDDSVDIRFALPEGVPHLGRSTVDKEKNNFYGITLTAEARNIPSETWTLTSGAVLPDSESYSGRILVIDHSLHDPGARFCSAGVEVGDILEFLPGETISCGALQGSAFRVQIETVEGETLTFDPSTLQAERNTDSGENSFEPLEAQIGPQCLAGPLHYRVRVSPSTFLLEGRKAGVLHPWTEAADGGCEKTTDDPLWTSRARVGTLKADREPQSCPITTDDPAIELLPFENPIFRFTITPGCALVSFRPTYPDPFEGVQYRFSTSSDQHLVTLMTGTAGSAIVAPPSGGPVFFVDPSEEAIYLINPATHSLFDKIN